MKNPFRGEPPTADRWTARYEELRRQVLAEPEGGGWGRALLLRRGLVAWMQAWPSDEEASKPAEPSVGATTLPTGLCGEVTRVLVNIILDRSKELVS